MEKKEKEREANETGALEAVKGLEDGVEVKQEPVEQVNGTAEAAEGDAEAAMAETEEILAQAGTKPVLEDGKCGVKT